MQLKFQARFGQAGAGHVVRRALQYFGRHGQGLPEISFRRAVSRAFPLRIIFSRHARHQAGFTLVELLVVLTLLGILAVGVVMSADGVEDDANVKLTKVEMNELRKALLQFKRDVGHFPDGLDKNHDEDKKLNLLFSCTDSSASEDAPRHDAGCHKFNIDTARGWNGPYALTERQKDSGEAGYFDAWGNRYRLYDADKAAPGSGIARIVSFGPDGRDGLPGKSNENAADCLPVDDGNDPPLIVSDDIVLCLVQ